MKRRTIRTYNYTTKRVEILLVLREASGDKPGYAALIGIETQGASNALDS